MKDADPEKYTFDLEPLENRHLMTDRGPGHHRLLVTNPTHDDPKYRSSTMFGFSEAELADLRDTVTDYLEDLRLAR